MDGTFVWDHNLKGMVGGNDTKETFEKFDHTFDKEVMFVKCLQSDYLTEDRQVEATKKLFPNANIVDIDSPHYPHITNADELRTHMYNYFLK